LCIAASSTFCAPLPRCRLREFQQSCVCSRKFVRLAQIFPLSLECLLAEHRAAIAFHGGVGAADELRCEHSFELVLRCDANEGAQKQVPSLSRRCPI
jgi:hypothetical protein